MMCILSGALSLITRRVWTVRSGIDRSNFLSLISASKGIKFTSCFSKFKTFFSQDKHEFKKTNQKTNQKPKLKYPVSFNDQNWLNPFYSIDSNSIKINRFRKKIISQLIFFHKMRKQLHPGLIRAEWNDSGSNSVLEFYFKKIKST